MKYDLLAPLGGDRRLQKRKQKHNLIRVDIEAELKQIRSLHRTRLKTE